MPYDPAFPLFDADPRQKLAHIYQKICTKMFMATLFIMGKKVETIQKPSTGQWINKLRYSHILDMI